MVCVECNENCTNVVSSNLGDGEVYSIQHYVIKFASLSGLLHQ